jgi:hypothetical protein
MAVAFLLGIYGFSQAYGSVPGSDRTIADNGFSALRLIVGQFPADLEGRPIPLALQVSRWALPLLTFWSTVVLAWEQLRNPVRLALIRARGDHLVIAGDPGADGGLAARTARAELDNGRRVLLWPHDRRAHWVSDAIEGGAAEVECAGDDRGVEELALDKARAALLLGEDAPSNIALASAIIAQAATVRAAGDPLEVILRIDDLDLRRSVEARFDAGDRKTARTRLASVPDILSRQLSLARPIDGFVREGITKRAVLAIGFTPLIERFILRTLAGGHYRDGGKPAFFVHDTDAAMIEPGFRARHPVADGLSPVHFVARRTDPALTPKMIADFVSGQGEPVAILIDQADDARALAIALAADAHYRAAGRAAPPIHVQLDGSYDPRLGAGIFPFGGLDALSDPEYLLQDRHDALARSIHDFYLEGRFAEGERIGARASMQEWEDLPESFRDDNRLVADVYQLKLRDIGARLIGGAGATFTLIDAELEELSRAEHDRWMAAKLVQGWTFGAVRDDKAKLHPDIIHYDDLSEAIKDLDREQVRIMARLLATSGQRALRTLTVALMPGVALPIDMLAQLAAHYPDRVPVFQGDLSDTASRAALVALHDAGQRVQAGLALHVMTLVDSLPASEQLQIAALLNDADRIIAADDAARLHAMLRGMADMIMVGAGGTGDIILAPDGAISRAPWLR